MVLGWEQFTWIGCNCQSGSQSCTDIGRFTQFLRFALMCMWIGNIWLGQLFICGQCTSFRRVKIATEYAVFILRMNRPMRWIAQPNYSENAQAHMRTHKGTHAKTIPLHYHRNLFVFMRAKHPNYIVAGKHWWHVFDTICGYLDTFRTQTHTRAHTHSHSDWLVKAPFIAMTNSQIAFHACTSALCRVLGVAVSDTFPFFYRIPFCSYSGCPSPSIVIPSHVCPLLIRTSLLQLTAQPPLDMVSSSPALISPTLCILIALLPVFSHCPIPFICLSAGLSVCFPPSHTHSRFLCLSVSLLSEQWTSVYDNQCAPTPCRNHKAPHNRNIVILLQIAKYETLIYSFRCERCRSTRIVQIELSHCCNCTTARQRTTFIEIIEEGHLTILSLPPWLGVALTLLLPSSSSCQTKSLHACIGRMIPRYKHKFGYGGGDGG